ncbi:ABC transporter permease [Methylocystis sp. 9N]|uniref:ABC transporter permease n=1 Tax=Methylocystis borbori TaxID=3118750 RepID=A0ABU7XF16_9HYPH
MLASIPLAYVAPFERAWRNRELIRAVARREFISRFRGSALGPLWAVLSPLFMLLTYTALFSITVPQLSTGMSVSDYASSIFIGLIVFNLFSELAYRAPMLLHEHVNFVKKSIFPSETIAWTATIRAFTYAGVAFGVYIGFRLLTAGGVPLTIVLTPFLVIPFALFILGVVWFLMALGAFTRDVAHIMASVVPMLMFATPIFYRLDQIAAMSKSAAFWLRLNIVGEYIEMLRAIALDGNIPNIFGYLVVVAISYAVFLGGYQFFMRYKSVIVDVI